MQLTVISVSGICKKQVSSGEPYSAGPMNNIEVTHLEMPQTHLAMPGIMQPQKYIILSFLWLIMAQ